MAADVPLIANQSAKSPDRLNVVWIVLKAAQAQGLRCKVRREGGRLKDVTLKDVPSPCREPSGLAGKADSGAFFRTRLFASRVARLVIAYQHAPAKLAPDFFW